AAPAAGPANASDAPTAATVPTIRLETERRDIRRAQRKPWATQKSTFLRRSADRFKLVGLSAWLAARIGTRRSGLGGAVVPIAIRELHKPSGLRRDACCSSQAQAGVP